ncbi:hypothetical protein [Streptomyces sclerotialus]|uniref:hypothetical protein n=1 Tax=Streptomyces sclerotialus TaxID=1957 RepID=UPI0004CBE5CB
MRRFVREDVSPECDGARLDEAARTTRVAGPARIADSGLGHLSPDRETGTLSGGESRRLKTARHLGSSLTGMTYVFDEPSTGLHRADVDGLPALLDRLVDAGSTVLVIEHDMVVVRHADRVTGLGGGRPPGRRGPGHRPAAGPPGPCRLAGGGASARPVTVTR